jgi:hypothetical protein
LLLKNGPSEGKISQKHLGRHKEKDKSKPLAHRISLEEGEIIKQINLKNIKPSEKETSVVQVTTVKFTGHSHHQSQNDLIKNRKGRRLLIRSLPGIYIDKYL